jgi:hypothetical protein
MLDFPDDIVGKSVELIASSTEDVQTQTVPAGKINKRTEEAIAFFRKNAVDLSKVEKWNREGLYE